MIKTFLTAEILGEPCAKGRPRVAVRNGRAHAYTPSATAKWEARAAATLADAWAGKAPLDEPLSVRIVAVFTRPGRLMRKSSPEGRVTCAVGKDCDNVAKAVLDAAQRAGVVRNDSRVACLRVNKVFASMAEGPRVEVVIESI